MSRKLGGEYRDQSRGRDYSVWDARRLFLRAVEEVAPELLESLVVDVYPLYQLARAATQPKKAGEVFAAWRTFAADLEVESSADGSLSFRESESPLPPDIAAPWRRSWQRWSASDPAWSGPLVQERRELQALNKGLRAWARSFPRQSWRGGISLEVAWFLDAAMDTLTHLDWTGGVRAFAPPRFIDGATGTAFEVRLPPPVSREEAQQVLRPRDASIGGYPGEVLHTQARGFFRPPFRYRPWLPQFKPARRYVREATRAFEQYARRHGGPSDEERRVFRRALAAYTRRARRNAERRGWRYSPHTRADSAEKGQDDEAIRTFTRLGLYFGGNTPKEIAAAEPVHQSTVRKSNAATAKLLGLDL